MNLRTDDSMEAGNADVTLAIELVIIGRVQGVGFRHSTVGAAERFGVRGYVRNAVDGSVIVHAEGESAALESFAAWCARGPALARVDRVLRRASQPQGLVDFRVKH
ncbi:MAG: acylphosphatase [Planctomycetota bacterium]